MLNAENQNILSEFSLIVTFHNLNINQTLLAKVIEMEKIVQKEFFCNSCSLQFYSKSVYDLHISLVHCDSKINGNRSESFTNQGLIEIKVKNKAN